MSFAEIFDTTAGFYFTVLNNKLLIMYSTSSLSPNTTRPLPTFRAHLTFFVVRQGVSFHHLVIRALSSNRLEE